MQEKFFKWASDTPSHTLFDVVWQSCNPHRFIQNDNFPHKRVEHTQREERFALVTYFTEKRLQHLP